MKDSVKHLFGEKLRNVRKRKGLTMKEVAASAGISESLVSQIETNRVSPSIDTLLSIAGVLEIDLEFLFSDLKRTKTVTVIRKNERSSRQLTGVTYQQLSSITDSSEEYAIEAVLLEIEPGAERGDIEYGHPGKELGYILKGHAELSYGTSTYTLNEGDSVSFASDIPHILKNCGQEILTALWVNTPPRIVFR